MTKCNAIGCNKTAEMKCTCSVFIIKSNKHEIHDIFFCRECYLKQKAMENEISKVESK